MCIRSVGDTSNLSFLIQKNMHHREEYYPKIQGARNFSEKNEGDIIVLTEYEAPL